jgi:ATP/maltotriose-dependent transcriptional regulator MalT
VPTPAYTPLLKARITIPPARPQVVVRERLVERLDAALNRPFTLISAPAGFGKTTLITSWISALADRSRVAWLALDEEDNDPVHFLYYLVATLQTLEPAVARAPISLLGSLKMPAPKDLMALLLNEISDAEERIVLVLDDYHVIENAEIDSAMAFFIERLLPRLRLIIATREQPNFPLARWRSLERVTEIGLEDLRFSFDEAEMFLKQTMGLDLDIESARTLETRTEGWVAGLQMAALSLQSRPRGESAESAAHRTLDFSGEHRFVIDYLATEVLRRQPPEIRLFLRQTAVLDRLCAPLCDAVTCRSDSKAILARLEKANMFLLPLDNRREWYRYHALFMDFLRSELEPDEEYALHRRASAWYESQGLGHEAMRHALATRDTDKIVRLFRAQVEGMLCWGEMHTLVGWLDALPEATVRAHSDLAGYKSWLLYLRGQNLEAQEYSELARVTPDSEPTAGDDGMLFAFQAYLALNWGDTADAIPLAEKALRHLGDSASFFRVYALNLLGQAQSLCGDRKAAAATLGQAANLGQRLGNHLMTLDALAHLTQLMQAQGQLREAIQLCQTTVERYVDRSGRPLPVAGLVYVPLGMLFYENNDLESARYCLTTGVALCQQLGMVYFRLMGQRALAKLQHVSGEREAAWNTLAAAREVAEWPDSPRRRRMVMALTAELHLREGNVAEAARALGETQKLRGAPSEQESLTFARLLLAQHHPGMAEVTLSRLEHAAREDECYGSLIAIHVLQALCKRAVGNHGAVVERLERAVSLAAGSGYRRVFLDEALPLAASLEKVRHVAPEFVNSLLQPIPGAEQAPAALPEPLSKSEREILRLLNRGLTNQEIADQLAITVGTTKWHLNRIFGKLQVRNRTEAISKGRELKLV